MADKKLIATIVSSREKGLGRREEGDGLRVVKRRFHYRETKEKAGTSS